MEMAASRMSRIVGCRLALLSIFMAMVLAPASSLSNVHRVPESDEDAEVIPGHVIAGAADGETEATASPIDLKKYNCKQIDLRETYTSLDY